MRKASGVMRMASLICHAGGTVWGITPVITTIISARNVNTMYMDR